MVVEISAVVEIQPCILIFKLTGVYNIITLKFPIYHSHCIQANI